MTSVLCLNWLGPKTNLESCTFNKNSHKSLKFDYYWTNILSSSVFYNSVVWYYNVSGDVELLSHNDMWKKFIDKHCDRGLVNQVTDVFKSGILIH